MIDQLQIILNTLGDLGEYAVYVVFAFFVWKLLTLASVLLTVKFAIQKLYEVVMARLQKPIGKVTKISIGHKLMSTTDATPSLIYELLELIKEDHFSFIHESNIRKAIAILKAHKDK